MKKFYLEEELENIGLKTSDFIPDEQFRAELERFANNLAKVERLYFVSEKYGKHRPENVKDVLKIDGFFVEAKKIDSEWRGFSCVSDHNLYFGKAKKITKSLYSHIKFKVRLWDTMLKDRYRKEEELKCIALELESQGCVVEMEGDRILRSRRDGIIYFATTSECYGFGVSKQIIIKSPLATVTNFLEILKMLDKKSKKLT